MKRILIACLMTGVLLLTCACGTSSGQTPTDPTNAPATQPTTSRNEQSQPDNAVCTLTVEVPSDWTTVYVYTWDPEAFGMFPGSEMTRQSDNTYVFGMDGTATNIIISNQDRAQTADLKVTPGVDVRMVIGSDCNASITYPNGDGGVSAELVADDTPAGELSNYRVVGSADWLGYWDPAFEGGRMTKVEDGIYRKEFENVPVGDYEIKVTKDGKWGGDIGNNGSNFCFTVRETGTIIVELILQGASGTIEVYGAEPYL